MSSPVRCFFAIDVPAALRQQLADVIDALRVRPNGDRVRWVRSEGLHVTLRFLGDVLPHVLPDVAASVAEWVRGIEPFDCRLRDLRPFPNARRPRVIAVSLTADGHLNDLAEAIEHGVVAAGISPEARGFHAHLTLGRLRGHAYPSLHDDHELGRALLPVDRVTLFKSDLTPQGAIYTEIEAIPLTGERSTSAT